MRQKKIYESVEMNIILFEADIVTLSDPMGEYDDKGTWKDTWLEE